MMSESENKFPKLLYISDVAVESTVAGSALIYRLLQNYPIGKLRIIEGNIGESINQKNRLPNVNYEQLNVIQKRLLNSRFSSLYNAYLLLTAKQRVSQLRYLVSDFKPDAILTVAHGFSLITAAKLADQLQLPLHVIIHDDWIQTVNLPQQLQKWAVGQFADIYRRAKSRFCISPYMVDKYEKCYGVRGTVLYPSRAADSIEFDQPAEKQQISGSSLIFAYAGSINSGAYAQSLILLAEVLKLLGGSLIIYSPTTIEYLQQLGLKSNNVTVRPLVPSSKLIYTLRNEADVLFVPMSFEPEHRSNMEISFPSKLTDCTAMGLPILIWGPYYCSAVRWAKENLGVAEVVDEKDVEMLTNAVKRLFIDKEYRFNLASKALTKGREFFSHNVAIEKFHMAIALNNQ